MKQPRMKVRWAKRQVVVIHGGESFRTYAAYRAFLARLAPDFSRYRAPRRGWKGLLGWRLGARFEVIRPDMPNKLNAKYAEWKLWFEKFIPHFAREAMFVGHSLGGLFLAKYFSENRYPKKIRAVLLVAAPWNDGDFRLARAGGLARFARQAGRIVLYQSKDDRVVRFADFEKYLRALPDATSRVFRDRGHFNQEAFPELVKDIRAAARAAA